eukprot:345517_1
MIALSILLHDISDFTGYVGEHIHEMHSKKIAILHGFYQWITLPIGAAVAQIVSGYHLVSICVPPFAIGFFLCIAYGHFKHVYEHSGNHETPKKCCDMDKLQSMPWLYFVLGVVLTAGVLVQFLFPG